MTLESLHQPPACLAPHPTLPSLHPALGVAVRQAECLAGIHERVLIARHLVDRHGMGRHLRRSNGNASQAAQLLRISRPTRYNVMSKHEALLEADDG